MNRFLFVIFVLIQFSCSPQKRNQKKTEIIVSEKSGGTTEITFNEEVHDFGTLVSGEIVVSTFTFTNSGKQNLNIEKIDAGCGCLQVKYPKSPVKPGDTGIIEVEFDSSGMFGREYKTIEIYANCKEPKHLAIFAVVKNEQLEIKY